MLKRSEIRAGPKTVSNGAGGLLLGIDTGGTYTDAVIFSKELGVVAKAKSLTTRHDLSIGIAGAAQSVIKDAGIGPERIGLVSMSTTLATNALVEGQGGRVALVMIGFDKGDIGRADLQKALGDDPVVFCQGGHDVHGNAKMLELESLGSSLHQLAMQVSGFAVAAQFSVRNPAHEIAARDMIRSTTGLPVTCSHKLSAKLGGPRRALTTLLNARLVPMIARLVTSTRRFLERARINAPLLVVRGDGALISSDLAMERPIETILSGPAASIVGAFHLTGSDNALISDIGGTTTDVAILENGKPRLDPDGAVVGGFRTMVEAVAMRTYGLGGDSEVRIEDGALDPAILLGPRRLVPLSLAADKNPPEIVNHLERQAKASNPGRLDGLFAVRTGLPDLHAAGLTAAEARLYTAIDNAPRPLDQILASNAQMATVLRLVSRGLVHVIGFTPSDAAHVLDRQGNWNRKAAILGAHVFSRRKNGRGQPVADGPEDISAKILRAVTRRSAEVIFQTAFEEDGLDGSAMLTSPLVQRALNQANGIVNGKFALDRPVIGLGASATLHYAGLSELTGVDCIIPGDADVANAVGAVAGQVKVSVTATISRPAEDRFRVSAGEQVRDFASESDAIAYAEEHLRELVLRKAGAAGTDSAQVELFPDIKSATIEGQRMFIEARLTVVAIGRPRIAA